MSMLRHPSRLVHEAAHPSYRTAANVTRGVGLFGLLVFGVAVVATISLLPDMARYIRLKSL